MDQPVVFISYSHQDEEEKEALVSHLRVLQMGGGIDLWSDDRIGAGQDWQTEISEAMERADVAVLLITANFLTSDFILTKEVPKLLDRRNKEGLIIFPIITKACAWKAIGWLARLNVRPKNGIPVWSDRESHVDEDLAKIAEEIAYLVQKDHVDYQQLKLEDESPLVTKRGKSPVTNEFVISEQVRSPIVLGSLAAILILVIVIIGSLVLPKDDEQLSPTPITSVSPSEGTPASITLANYPTGAIPKQTAVLIWQFSGCEENEIRLKQQLEQSNDLVDLLNTGEITVEVLTKPYNPDSALPPADLHIWGNCEQAQTTYFKLQTRRAPPEVFFPEQLSIVNGVDNQLVRKIALGLILYQRGDYVQATERLAVASNEAAQPTKTELTLLYGNSLLFQDPPQFEAASVVYQDAALDAGELRAYLHNNRGIALFSRDIESGEMTEARKAFDQAITFNPEEPWFYFNLAYAWLNGKDADMEKARTHCKTAQQKAELLDEPLSKIAGYACETEVLLMASYTGSSIKETEIQQAIASVADIDVEWSLQYFLRGAFNEKLGFMTEAKEQYACYLLLTHDNVKLPFELIRIGVARQYLIEDNRALEQLCPLFLGMRIK